jgi:hypothetical protein
MGGGGGGGGGKAPSVSSTPAPAPAPVEVAQKPVLASKEGMDAAEAARSRKRAAALAGGGKAETIVGGLGETSPPKTSNTVLGGA